MRALPDLIQRTLKVQEILLDDLLTKDMSISHTLLAPLQVNAEIYSAKITLREALKSKASPAHKFYDIAALEIKNGSEVSGLKGVGTTQSPLPAPFEPIEVTVWKLASAVNGLGFEAGVSKMVDADGKPLVVYHSTEGDFSTFRNGAAYFTPRQNCGYIRNSSTYGASSP